MRSGRPQRAKIRRNIARISAAGTRSQRPWGGNLGAQQGAGGLVGHRQPADPLAVGQGDLLDGVDLPDLVGQGRLRDDGGGRPAAPGPMDPGADEGELEAPHRRDGRAMSPRPSRTRFETACNNIRDECQWGSDDEFTLSPCGRGWRMTRAGAA